MVLGRAVGRSTRATVGVVALALGVAVALAGCSSTASGTATHTPKPTVSKAASGPTPKPTPTFAALDYTCNSILPPATLSVFKSKASAGFSLQTDYLQRMQNIGSNLVTFNTYGGILCQWAYPNAEKSVAYAFSPITDDETTEQEATLTTNGYVGVPKYHGTLYTNTDTTDYPDEYLFIDGYWFQASTDDVMELLVDNVFVTS